MKKNIDKRIILIVLLVIVLSIMLIIYFTKEDEAQIFKNQISNIDNKNMDFNNSVNTSSSSKTIQATSEIISGLTENIELHATYYLSEIYVQANQEVKKGENLLKYTNGTYLIAPYDCVITKLNLPSVNGICNNEHYISVSSINNLAIKFKVDETKISNIYVGKSAKIKISALDDTIIEGYVTNISSTASNGNFTAIVNFENKGNIKIGMTGSVEI